MEVKVLTVAQNFLDGLDKSTNTKIYKCIRLLKEFGKKLVIKKELYINVYFFRSDKVHALFEPDCF